MKISNLREFIALWLMCGDDHHQVLENAIDNGGVEKALANYALWSDMQLPTGENVFNDDFKLTPEAVAYLGEEDEDFELA